jgi:hypothetical protein
MSARFHTACFAFLFVVVTFSQCTSAFAQDAPGAASLETQVINFSVDTIELGQGTVPGKPSCSRSELKRLIRTAHRPEEFNALADYFDGEREQYVQKARDEQIELDRRLAAPYVSPKYPTPVDSARALLQYYEAEAEEYGRRADGYRLRATETSNEMSGPR